MATNTAPVISATVEDVNSRTVYLTTGRTTGRSFTLIKYHSDALATMTATPQEGAVMNMDLYIIRNGDRTGYGASYTFDNVESNVFTFSAEDDKGNVGRRSVTANMIDYIRPTCNISNSRPDANGNMTLSCSGHFFNESFGAVSNSLNVRYVYQGSDGSTGSGEMELTVSGNAYSAYAYLSGLDYQATYYFAITVEDELEVITSTTKGITSKPVFHWGKNDFVFEVPVAFNGTGTTAFKGDVRLKGDGNYGNTLYFGDGTYCYIQEPTDDNMLIKAKSLNFDVKSLSMNGNPITLQSGAWTPSLNGGVVEQYLSQEGWYMKLGDIVVIGWYIRASIEANSHTLGVEIQGCPFTPGASAFGGGVAFNIYTSAGFIFEGWGIDTAGDITPRLQPCNGTTAGNLQIASSAGYPYGGGTVTLAGTICFMI